MIRAEEKKKGIQKKFTTEMSLLVDKVKFGGSGTSNDENTWGFSRNLICFFLNLVLMKKQLDDVTTVWRSPGNRSQTNKIQ